MPNYHPRELRSIFKTTENILKNNPKTWYNEDYYYKRKHILMTSSNLKVMCKFYGINVRDINKNRKEDLIKAIVDKFMVENESN